MRNEGYDFIAKELAEVGDFERALLVAEKLMMKLLSRKHLVQ